MKVAGEYFSGNKISNYGIENGYVDYATLAKSFDHVLKNDAINWFEDFEPVSGDCDREVMQWYIVSASGADLLEEIGEIVYYSAQADLHLWGVTHWGTLWDYVLTNIRCNAGYGEEN